MIDDPAVNLLARARVPSRVCAPGPSINKSPYSALSPPRVPTEVEVETAVLRDVRRRRADRFLKGPVRMNDIAAAAQLPGKALAVYLAIRHRTDLTRKNAVKLPAGLMRDLGVSKDAKARALRQLEAAGMITVRRQDGQSPIIALKREGE
jgi:DNA-binding transcriptional ArsR family regulator